MHTVGPRSMLSIALSRCWRCAALSAPTRGRRRRSRAHLPRRERAHGQGPRGGRPDRRRDRRQRPRRAGRDAPRAPTRAGCSACAFRVAARLAAAAARAGEGPAGTRRRLPRRRRRLPQLPEMVDETAAIAAAYPSIVQRFSLGTSLSRAATIWALKISDNVATDEAEPEVLFTANQHAREHLTVEMAMYLLNELTSQYGTDTRITSVVNTREIWIVPSINPDGAGVRRRDRLLRGVAQEPPAQRGLDRGRHRPQPQLGLAVGLLRRLERHVLLGDLPRPVAVLGARDRSACATSSTRASSAACSRSRPASTSTRTPSSSCGPTATRPPTRRRA